MKDNTTFWKDFLIYSIWQMLKWGALFGGCYMFKDAISGAIIAIPCLLAYAIGALKSGADIF